MNRKKAFFLFIVLCFVSCFASCQSVIAEESSGWVGEESIPTSGGGGGSNSGSGCDSTANTFRLDCAGVSWIYYKAITPTTEAVRFPAVPTSLDVYIPATCSNNGEGGFWHYGANLFGANIGYSSEKWGDYYTKSGIYGHWKTLNWGYAPWGTPLSQTNLLKGPNELVGKPLNQVIGNNAYQASYYGTEATVLENFKKAYYYTHNEQVEYTGSSLPSNVYAFCYWEGMGKEVTLTVKAVDIYGNPLPDSTDQIVKQKSGSSGVEITVEVPQTINGYTKKYCANSPTSDRWNSTAGNCSKIISEDTTIYAVYADTSNMEFEAKAVGTNGSTTLDTGWQSDTSVTKPSGGAQQFECSNASGCTLTFKFSLREKTNTSQTTYYGIERKRDDGDAERLKTEKVNSITDLTFSDTIKSGETLCYSIIFHYKGGTENDDRRSETVCFAATTTPPPPQTDCVGSGLLDMFVQNPSAGYSNWTKNVYAKPGDNLSFCTYYNPSTYQGTSGYKFTSYDCAGKYNCYNFIKPLGLALGLTNTIETKQSVRLNSDSFSGSRIFQKNYGGGNTDAQSETNSYLVSISNTGDSIDQKANTTGRTPTGTAQTDTTPDGTSYNWCPYDSYDCIPHNCSPCLENSTDDEGNVTGCAKWTTCYYTCYKHYTRASISTSTAYSPIAHAHVPYNFVNTTAVTTSDSTIVYAGEEQLINFNITVSPKWNSATNGYYATQVHGAIWKLRVCFNGTCYDTNDSSSENLNMDSTSGSTVSRSKSIVIPDVAAGTKVCVSSLIYPANSGSNTNWDNPSGSGTWAESSQKCYTVAKRPSIQFWGGNIYSSNPISTSTSFKYHVANVTSYNADLANYATGHAFGSWVDQGAIGGSVISGLSSGAALGYSLGSTETKSGSYCNRIPLSFANRLSTFLSSCPTTTGQLGSSTSTSNSSKSTLKDKYIYNEKTISIGEITTFRSDQGDDKIYRGNNTYYYDNQSSLTVGNSSSITDIIVPKNTTQVVYAKNDLTVNANLIYGSRSETYTSLATIPKLILYAENEVRINCAVSRIDAVIVAKKVTTCAEGSTSQIINDQVNSNQLFVNGAIITSSLVANRTYGASIGYNSAVAAEIINFDPSLYYLELTSANKNDSGDNASTNLSTTYQKELAPRY